MIARQTMRDFVHPLPILALLVACVSDYTKEKDWAHQAIDSTRAGANLPRLRGVDLDPGMETRNPPDAELAEAIAAIRASKTTSMRDTAYGVKGEACVHASLDGKPLAIVIDRTMEPWIVRYASVRRDCTCTGKRGIGTCAMLPAS